MEVPTQPAGRAKRMYVTEGLVAEFGRTPSCPRCEGGTQAHSERCRQRISQILSDRGRAPPEAALQEAPVADETAPMALEVYNNPNKAPVSAAEQAPTTALAQETARSSADATMARSVESRDAEGAGGDDAQSSGKRARTVMALAARRRALAWSWSQPVSSPRGMLPCRKPCT